MNNFKKYITIILTLVFVYLCIMRDNETLPLFIPVYSVVIGHYFDDKK